MRKGTGLMLVGVALMARPFGPWWIDLPLYIIGAACVALAMEAAYKN